MRFTMEIRGTTRVTGLFGYPVTHSLSPAMHNAAFEHAGLDYCYVTFPVRPRTLKDAVAAIRALHLRGVNVTVPHKEDVIPFLDEVDQEASFIGAVNTILNEEDALRGFNTDGRGFMESLADASVSVTGKTVLVIGAGGACRAISYYLSERVEKLLLFDIDEVRVKKLLDDLGAIRSNVYRMKVMGSLDGIDMIINATPLGLKDTDPYPVDVSLIREGMAVCDLIYKTTPLLKAATQKGCMTIDGLGMLLHQGVLAFEIWTGVKPPVDIMRRALRSRVPSS
jgi:shikimate dehydrogenase